jgi:hypothetical protein
MESEHTFASKFFLAAALTLVAGCVTTTEGTHPREVPTSPWLAPSPGLRQQIEDQAQRLPWTQGRERIEQIHWFATVGEPAYTKLLELAQDPRADVAGSALAALGATRDSRLVTTLREIPWNDRGSQTLRYERARMFLRLGDWHEAPVLIAGLRDESVMMRALCAQALFESTGERYGYDAKDPVLVREEGVANWEAWWKDREREGILNATH